MPRGLLSRCQPDSIAEFRAAARMRYAEGEALLDAGHRLGAIYLWGYTSEMIVKAAYFAVSGLREREPITWAGHLKPAIELGRKMQIAWPHQGAGHNVRAWAELLIRVRRLSPATAFEPAFAAELQRRGESVDLLWRETLRYHKNSAYLHEADRIRDAAQWLLIYQNML